MKENTQEANDVETDKCKKKLKYLLFHYFSPDTIIVCHIYFVSLLPDEACIIKKRPPYLTTGYSPESQPDTPLVELEEPLLTSSADGSTLGQDICANLVMEGVSITLNNEQHNSDAMSTGVGVTLRTY